MKRRQAKRPPDHHGKPTGNFAPLLPPRSQTPVWECLLLRNSVPSLDARREGTESPGAERSQTGVSERRETVNRDPQLPASTMLILSFVGDPRSYDPSVLARILSLRTVVSPVMPSSKERTLILALADPAGMTTVPVSGL